MESSGGSTFTRRDDGAILASMPAPQPDAYTFRLKSPAGGIRALRLDALLDPSLAQPHIGPGRDFNNGLFDVTGLDVAATAADGAETPVEVVAAYSHPWRRPGVGPIDAVRRTPIPMSYPHWGGDQGTPNVAVLHFRDDDVGPEEIVVKAEFNGGKSIGCLRFYGSADPAARLPESVVTLVRESAPADAPPRPIVVGKPIDQAGAP